MNPKEREKKPRKIQRNASRTPVNGPVRMSIERMRRLMGWVVASKSEGIVCRERVRS
jgi:hypothetical protein